MHALALHLWSLPPCGLRATAAQQWRPGAAFRALAVAAAPEVRTLMAGAGTGIACASAAGAGLPPEPANRGAGDAGAARVPSPSDWGNPARRLTDVILALNMLCFVGQHATGHLLTAMGAKVNSLVMAGQWWRLLTPAFLHSGLLHLVVNCHALNTIGPEVERTSGRGRFAAVYVASTLVGTALSVALTPAPSIGASAAIFGLGAAAAVYYYRHRSLLGPTSKRMLQSLGWSLAINAVYSAANRRIDNWGHLGGMLGGAAVAWLLGPTFVPLTGSAGLLADRPLVPLLASKGSFALKK